MADRSISNMERVGFGLLLYLVIISLFFFIVKPTLLFLSCFVFAAAGGIEFAVALMIVADKKSKLPQDWVFPIVAKSYMVINLIASAIFILLEQKVNVEIRLIWVFLVHITLISFFTWRVLALHAGKKHMEAVNEVATSNVEFQRSKTASLAAIKARVGGLSLSASEKNSLCREIQKVFDAIRYSDPMTPSELFSLDDKISDKISELASSLKNNSFQHMQHLCGELIIMIKERNEQIKALKTRK